MNEINRDIIFGIYLRTPNLITAGIRTQLFFLNIKELSPKGGHKLPLAYLNAAAPSPKGELAGLLCPYNISQLKDITYPENDLIS